MLHDSPQSIFGGVHILVNIKSV